MPLFGRRLFLLGKDDANDDPEHHQQQQIYTIEHTGETFRQAKLYDQVKQIYELERWTCECTSRSALTHKDAHESEVETRKSLATMVPEYFHKPIFDIVHHSVKTLEKLAEEVSILLGQGFAVGEPVQFKKRKDTTIVKGLVERIEDNDDQRKRTSERASVQSRPPSDKQMKNVKYAIRLADEDRVISNIQPNELQRSSLLPNREKLKTFIRSYTIRLGNRADSPWVFYDQSNVDKYHVKSRLPADVIEDSRKAMTITLDEILRDQERMVRKQAEEQAALLSESKKTSEEKKTPSLQNGHTDEIEIILSDDAKPLSGSPKKKVKSNPTTPRKSSQSNASPTKKVRSTSKSKSPSKSKKQLTLHDMKFTKNSTSNSNHQLLQRSSSTPSTSVTTCNVAVPYSLLQKLDKTRRDRGIQSKLFQRLILHCARTLNDKQRLRLPDEYRVLIQMKYEELELKRRLSEMTEQEKKVFLQNKHKQKQLEDKPMEDLDLTSSSKTLPIPLQIESLLAIPPHYIGDLLVVCTFFTSCHSLFHYSLTDDLSKTTQQFLRSFKHDYLIQAYTGSSTGAFFNYFIELLQILMKLLFKEDENRSSPEETTHDDDVEKPPVVHDQQAMETNVIESLSIDDDIEQAYDIKLTDIPLTPFTCQELTRLYLLREKDEINRTVLEKLAHGETKDFSISEQIDLLLLLVNLITTDSELMSDYFEYLTRTMSETYRERNQLMAERRKAQEEDSKQKKLQLQNGENGKVASKKQTKNSLLLTPKSSLGTTNDENRQASPIVHDDMGDVDSGGDDDLKTVTQRRRQMVAASKELKEKRELEAQKLHNEQKRELAIQKAEQAYQDALLNLQFGFRIKPLGFDRYYNRYWFFKGHAGLFVEKGWIGPDVNYCVQASSSQDVSSPRSISTSVGEKLIPKDESNQWWTYDNENAVEQLIHSLNDRGIREQNLLVNLKKILPLLHAEFEQAKAATSKSKTTSEQAQEEPASNADASNDQQQQLQPNDIIGSFKNDLEDIEARLRHGSLGGFIVAENFNDWHLKLKQSTERAELAELLVQLQQTVAEKYASGIFGTHELQSKTAKISSRKKPSPSKSSANHQQHLHTWMNDCRSCKTFSRLYVLMMIFENAVAWNKSTVGLKCKICRKKSKDEYVVVCDQCCQGYHFECLRGYSNNQAKTSLNELWYCPACRPQLISTRRGGKQSAKVKADFYDADIYDMDVETKSSLSSHEHSTHGEHQQDLSDFDGGLSGGDDDDDDANGEHDEIHSDEEHSCSVCGVEASEENELIQCIQCRSLFHCQCHEPPLRCAPRSTTWMCNSCRTGVNNETNQAARRPPTRRQMAMKKREEKSRRQQPQRHNGTRRVARKNYREVDDDDDDDDDDESDYERETTNQRRSKRLRQSSPTATDKSNDEPASLRARRRVHIAKSTSSSSSSASEDNDDEAEQMLTNHLNEESDIEQENGDMEVNAPSSS